MVREGWLSEVSFWIKDDPTAPGVGGGVMGAAVGASGQGFSVTRDEAEKLLRQVQGVLNEIDSMERKAERLMKVTPPAQDPASLAFNTQLVGDGQEGGAFRYGLGHLKRERGYLAELVKRLNEALGRTVESDDAAATVLDRATDGGIAQ